MKKIFKYPLKLQPIQTITMLQGAGILHIDTVNDDIYCWAVVDTDNKLASKQIWMFATGEEILNYDDLVYLGTVKQCNGKFIWHFYERAQ